MLWLCDIHYSVTIPLYIDKKSVSVTTIRMEHFDVVETLRTG